MITYDKIEQTPEYEAGFLACVRAFEIGNNGPSEAIDAWVSYGDAQGYNLMQITDRAREARFRFFRGWDAAR